MKNQASRLQWVDIAKGIAIILVVALHIRFAYPSHKLFPLVDMLRYVYVPAFFIIGGFFINEDKLSQPHLFIKGKIRTLYLPLLYFYVPAVLMHNLFLDIGWYDPAIEYGGKIMSYLTAGEIVKNVVLTVCLAGREPIMGAMWFVYVLFMALCGLSVVSWLLRKVFHDGRTYEIARCVTLLALCVLACTATRIIGFNIPRFNNVFTAMWLIYCGYMIMNRFKWSFGNWWVLGVSVLLWWHIASTAGGVGLNGNYFADVVTLTVGCVAALYVLGYVSRRLANCLWGGVITYCGRNSFYIMALHFAGFGVCSVVLRSTGIGVEISTRQVGESVSLLLAYLAFGIMFPLAFMWLFRLLKRGVVNIYKAIGRHKA